MAVVSAREFEAVQSELSVFQLRLRSKEEALRILKGELDSAHSQEGRLRQEIAQLRSQLARSPASAASPKEDTVREREQFIAQLEEAGEKITSLERQLRNMEDEKEDIMSERDHYSSQVTHLRRCLDEKESASPPTQSAFQGIMEENRRLKLQLVEAQAERDHALSKAERHKRAVEHWKTRDTQTQQLQFLSSDKQQDMWQSLRRVSELEALANSLSESVKEKSIALSHQKKANKMLATRIAELEHRLRALEISGLWSNTEAVMPELSWAEDSRGFAKSEGVGPSGDESERKLSKECGPRTVDGRGDGAGSTTTEDTDPQSPNSIVELT